ncbi:hypothetical protein DRN87_01385 [Candidatus Geothermarchaeota archaeon]|nr:MAG: hypothetical protein DRN87_01385 [Candidatus Geothermarchaeota archaeon]
MKKAIILGGVGAVGIEATYDFIETSGFDEIVIADYNINKALEVVKRVGDNRVSAVKVDVTDEYMLKDVLKGFDIVINALPFKYDYIVTRYAVELGLNGVDVATEEDQYSLNDAAVEKGVTFVPGVGATPGTTNIMTKKGVELLDEVDTIEIYWAAFRSTAPSPGLLYTTIWEFDPNLKERVIYEYGEWKQVPPFTGVKEVEFFPLIGKRLTVYVPHSETWTLPEYLDKNPKKVYVRGTWPDETMNLLKTLLYYGFYSNKPIEIDGVLIKPMDFIYKFLLSRPEAKKTEIWGYGLRVEVTGVKDGRRAKVIVMNKHPHPDEWGGSRAYFKCIGIPLSIGAQLIARGSVSEKGVIPPEAAYNPDEFFEELGKRGIEISWKIEYL